MSLIGIITGILFFLSLAGFAVTEKRQWLSVWIWCGIAFLVLFFTPENGNINGLVLLICAIMCIQIIYSLWGVKLWCTDTRKRKGILFTIIFVTNYILCIYCFYQSLSLTSIFEGMNAKKLILFLISVAAAAVTSCIMQGISVSAVDLYFSQKLQFPLIDCSPVIKEGLKDSIIKKQAIKGVQNGITYNFYMTQKAHLLLKPYKSFVFNVKKGVFGGIYVVEDVYAMVSKRRIKRVNRLLGRKVLFAFLCVLLIILLFIRIITGANFEEIFLMIGRGVLIGIK